MPIPCEDGSSERIALTRIHFEEDAGKSLHEASATRTLLDFNRAGAPLVEIVTEPCLRRASQAQAFLLELRRLVRWLGVSDGNMEQGSLRCDCNLSLRPMGQSQLGTRVELKNLNSIRSVGRAIEHEIGRQAALLSSGETVAQGTRHWDEAAGVSRAMREKEGAPDYRFFPDPDLPPLIASAAQQTRVAEDLGELPLTKELRLERDLGLPREQASLVCSSRSLAAFFEALAEVAGEPREAANWVVGELLREVAARELDLDSELVELPVSVDQVAELMALVTDGSLSISAAKSVFAAMAGSSHSPTTWVERLGLAQLSDEGELAALVARVLAANPQALSDHRSGKSKSFGFLVGAVMKESGGRANPQLVRELLRSALEAE